MATPAVLLTCERLVALITLNRPRKGNAVTQAMGEALVEACQQVRQQEDSRVVIVTGTGPAFCIGGEPVPPLDAGLALDPARGRAAWAIATLPIPTIAAINGDALGQGLELALACDLRISARDARLGMPQLLQGTLPWDGGTQRLPRLVGRAHALELLLTGRLLTAQEALSIGLVNRVVAPGKALEEARALGQELAQHGPIALRYTKEAVLKGMDLPLAEGLRLEGDLNFLLHSTTDRAEGIRSFLERRPPQYHGR